MAKTVPMIGIEPTELGWIRLLVFLLRHPDPIIPELARQALRHIEKAAADGGAGRPGSLDHAG